jgi:hypothetical protein
VYVLASQYWGEGPGAQELIIDHNTLPNACGIGDTVSGLIYEPPERGREDWCQSRH